MVRGVYSRLASFGPTSPYGLASFGSNSYPGVASLSGDLASFFICLVLSMPPIASPSPRFYSQ